MIRYLITSLLLLAPAAYAEPGVILITSNDLKESWQPFAKWKTDHGKPTTIITTEEIDEKFEGPDIQEKIRLCVRENIDENDTRWVILGGDSLPGGKGIVPDRDTIHRTQWGQNKDIPTDIYYISPTNWDADGDGIYGEFEDDKEAISYPDGSVGLGRIPMRTAEDVAAYTDKMISFESNYPKGDFANQMIYTCTVAGAYPKVRTSWDDHISKALPDGKITRLFSEDNDLTPAGWVEMINKKQTGKFHFHGHGLINGWVLDKRKMFTAKDIKKLTNKDAYPIITTVSCFTGEFDSAKDPCITESMLRAPEAGAIAIVAPCREGKPHFLNPRKDFELMVTEGKMDGTTTTMTMFWEHGIKDNLTTGEALMKTKAELVEKAKESSSFHMCISEINLLGDPTIQVHPVSSKSKEEPAEKEEAPALIEV